MSGEDRFRCPNCSCANCNPPTFTIHTGTSLPTTTFATYTSLDIGPIDTSYESSDWKPVLPPQYVQEVIDDYFDPNDCCSPEEYERRKEAAKVILEEYTRPKGFPKKLSRP